jgi:hypothetical protein
MPNLQSEHKQKVLRPYLKYLFMWMTVKKPLPTSDPLVPYLLDPTVRTTHKNNVFALLHQGLAGNIHMPPPLPPPPS